MDRPLHSSFHLRCFSMKLISGGSTWLLLFLWVMQFPMSSALTPRFVLRMSPLTKDLEDEKPLFYFRKEPLKMQTYPLQATNRRVFSKSVPGVNFDTGSRRSYEDSSQQSPAEDRIFHLYYFPSWWLDYGYFEGPFGRAPFPGPGYPGGPPFVPPIPPVVSPPFPPSVNTRVVVGGVVVGGAGGTAVAGTSGPGPGPPSGSYYGGNGRRYGKRKKQKIQLDPGPDEDQGPCQSTPYHDSY